MPTIKSEIDGTFGQVTFTGFDGPTAPPALSSAQIDRFESDRNLELPDDYKAFLLQLNGGKVSPRSVAYHYGESERQTLSSILSPTDEILTDPVTNVRYFYALGHPTTSLSLEHMQVHVEAWGRPGLFGIAGTSHSGMIVLDLAEGEFFGSVYFLLYEGVAELVEHGIEVPLGYIAPNFTAFQGMFFDFDSVLDVRFQEHLKSLED